jgi:FkbM family methyltransferase
MTHFIKNLIKSWMQYCDIGITRYSNLQALLKAKSDLIEKNKTTDDIEFLLALPSEHCPQLLRVIRKSKSQFRQDLFVLSHLDFKRDGFFVEFGATNGIELSNTFLLEKEFGWNGILAEPAKCWHARLKNNRSAHIDYNCVWSESNSLINFNDADIMSRINLCSGTDNFGEARANGNYYAVKTISLNDLLAKYGAPHHIDYLSIDTEGSEFPILHSLDFSKYSFSVITCEHNFTPTREKLFSLLTRNGYLRVHEDLSKCDDWYVKI